MISKKECAIKDKILKLNALDNIKESDLKIFEESIVAMRNVERDISLLK